MKNYFNAYDISTEEAIMLHANSPALIRRNKERNKAKKYAYSNANTITDVRCLGKNKYRDYARYCDRQNMFDYDISVEPLQKHYKNIVNKEIKEYFNEQEALVNNSEDYYDYFISDDEQTTSILSILFVALITLISFLLKK